MNVYRFRMGIVTNNNFYFHIYFRANLNYDISMKGKHIMTQREQIKNLILANEGMIQTSQVLDMGISKTVLYQYVKENDMEQISHGVYATKDAWKDAMHKKDSKKYKMILICRNFGNLIKRSFPMHQIYHGNLLWRM